MQKSKIGWTDITHNYIRGCLNNCSYCYARRFNKRTWKKMYDIECLYRIKNGIDYDETNFSALYNNMQAFKPVFMYSQFTKPLPKNPMRIFMDSMSDICYWKTEWMERVLDKIRGYPQHKFLFLSKEPEIYLKYIFPLNCWIGITITNDIDLHDKTILSSNNKKFNKIENKIFISIEPIRNNIFYQEYLLCYDWIIVGAESGNRKNKIIPEKKWIENIRQYCRNNNIPFYEKDNLKNILNRELIQEFPDEIK